MLGRIKTVCTGPLAWLAGVQALAADSPYTFKQGFPANEATIKRAQDATDMRRAIEAYKFFFPTVATEAGNPAVSAPRGDTQ